AGEFHDSAAWCLADRPCPRGEAEQLREALSARLVEHDPARTLAHRDDPFGAQRRERLANRAARDGELLHQLALGGQLRAALVDARADGASQRLCDGAMTGLFSCGQDVHTRCLAYADSTINIASDRCLPV